MKFTPIVLAVVTVLALAGCTVSTGTSASSATPSATPVPSVSASVPVDGGLSFDAGNDLDSSIDTAPAFANGFSNPESGWVEQDGTDAAQGHWVYDSSDGLCTTTLSQIVIGDNFTITKDDDRTTSDAALEWYFRDSPSLGEQVSSLVADAAIPYGTGWQSGDPGAEFRGFVVQASDGTILAAYARAFGVPGIVLYFDMTCTTSDAFTTNSTDALLNSAVVTF